MAAVRLTRRELLKRAAFVTAALGVAGTERLCVGSMSATLYPIHHGRHRGYADVSSYRRPHVLATPKLTSPQNHCPSQAKQSRLQQMPKSLGLGAMQLRAGFPSLWVSVSTRCAEPLRQPIDMVGISASG